MKKYLTPTTVYITTIIILSLAIVSLLIFISNQPAPNRGVAQIQPIQPFEPDNSKWGVNFPNQYSSFLKTLTNNTRTAFGGSEPFSHLENDPKLKVLFAGMPFSKEYNEDRGHMNALADVRNTGRLGPNSPATCYSCKTADNPKLWNELGMAAYDRMLFTQLSPRISNSIGCANCHDANSMRLVVTNPALDEALKAQGKDWRSFTRQEMRSVVCANCHVEYYFTKDGNYLVFPWKYGTNIEAMEKLYQEIQFTDWTHPDSGASMIKMQHPDYELYVANSTHFKAGVSCADCHMPYTRDGAAKFSSHDVKSPLIDNGKACAACHTDVNYVLERVTTLQNQVKQTMQDTETALVSAIDAIKTSSAKPEVDKVKIDEARQLHRRAQMRWDYIAAGNSMGFHNPEEALRILASATDLARQSQILALLAAGK